MIFINLHKFNIAGMCFFIIYLYYVISVCACLYLNILFPIIFHICVIMELMGGHTNKQAIYTFAIVRYQSEIIIARPFKEELARVVTSVARICRLIYVAEGTRGYNWVKHIHQII